MFKQGSNRYPRSKGFKVKHAFQIALLVAVSIWLLYQVKHSHDKKQAYEKQASLKAEASGDGGSGWNSDVFGRKGKVEIPQDVGDTVDVVKHEGNTKEEEETVDRHETVEENGNEDHGGGDDELDRHEDEKTEEESQEEHERIRENAMNNEAGKESEAEEEEQNGDVGAKFAQMKQENGDTEESSEAKDEHNESQEEIPESKDKEHDNEQSLEDKNIEVQTEHNESEDEIAESKDKEHINEQNLEDNNAENQTEGNNADNQTEHNESEDEVAESKVKEHINKQSLEDKNAENQTEIGHGLDHPLATGGEDVERNSTESVESPETVLEKNETASSNLSSEGENVKETSSGTMKIEEVVPKQNEISSLDSGKDVAVVDPNTAQEGKKLEEKNQESNATLSDSVQDSKAEADGKKQEENNKEVIIAEQHEIGWENNATTKHDIQADSDNGFHDSETSESKNGTELSGQTKSDNTEHVSSVDQGTAKGEIGVPHGAMSEDAKGLTSLDQDEAKAEHSSTLDHETTSDTDKASEGDAISASSETNSTMESVHSDAGDAISQDMPEENEMGDHTDLGTLPEGEAEGQTTEELSVQ